MTPLRILLLLGSSVGLFYAAGAAHGMTLDGVSEESEETSNEVFQKDADDGFGKQKN